jgi:hypothetical protein
MERTRQDANFRNGHHDRCHRHLRRLRCVQRIRHWHAQHSQSGLPQARWEGLGNKHCPSRNSKIGCYRFITFLPPPPPRYRFVTITRSGQRALTSPVSSGKFQSKHQSSQRQLRRQRGSAGPSLSPSRAPPRRPPRTHPFLISPPSLIPPAPLTRQPVSAQQPTTQVQPSKSLINRNQFSQTHHIVRHHHSHYLTTANPINQSVLSSQSVSLSPIRQTTHYHETLLFNHRLHRRL